MDIYEAIKLKKNGKEVWLMLPIFAQPIRITIQIKEPYFGYPALIIEQYIHKCWAILGEDDPYYQRWFNMALLSDAWQAEEKFLKEPPNANN